MLEVKEVPVDAGDPVPEYRIKKGPMRSFLVTEPTAELSALRTPMGFKERASIVLLLAFTSAVRLYRLSYPDSVVFDEVHFGGFASKYIKGSFFMDVHPPLAKLLFAGVANLAGFKGDFGFESIGDDYVPSVPYVLMRFFAGACGVFTVLLLYLTLRSSGVRQHVASFVALCFAIENSFVTISRYILLDSPLMFFIAIAVYAYKRYELYPSNSINSYKSLFAVAVALGLACSSKWVGLFTFAWVGVLSIWSMWFQLGDLTTPVCSIVKRNTIKALFLLLIPGALYMLFFQIHFNALPNYADGAGFFSSAFRTSLSGNNIPSNILADVGVGSTVTIRHVGTMGGYLHSHDHPYETGSKQQQITLYPHLDQNNDWFIELYNESNTMPTTFEGLGDGTKIRLKHVLTSHRLHSHDHKPPVSESSDWQKEVSGYGFVDFEGDANDDWIIDIDQDASAPGAARQRVRAIETKFRLRHAMTGCLLFSHEVKLPKWAYEQQEVTCATQGQPSLTLWYVEGNTNPLLPEDAERISYKRPSFLEKFVEVHKRMWHINSNLKEPHIYQSDPLSWPFLLRGLSYWSKDHRQVYLMGNPVLWWSVTIFIGIFAFSCLLEVISWQVGTPILQDKSIINFHIQTTHYLLGYALHYLPSFLMDRQLFLHHYLPAYYFGILAFGHGLDIFVSYILKNRKTIAYSILTLYFAMVAYFYMSLRPLIYGSEWTKDLCLKTQLLPDWDYTCNHFPQSLNEYERIDKLRLEEKTNKQSTPVVPPTSLGENSVPEEASKIDVNIDELIADPEPKRFVDQHGNPLSPEHVAQIVKEQGGYIKAISKVAAENLL